jgi:hypothetical protein
MQTLDGSFSFTEALRAAARWRSAGLLLAAGALGALAGGLFLLSHPPLYEAQTTLTVEIDLSHTGELTIIEEDHVLGVVDALISSTQVHEQVAAAALAEGIDTDLYDLEERLQSERFFSEWTLRVRHEDAQTAVHLADLWAANALDTLQAGGGFARQVDALYRRDDSYENCFKGSPAQPVHAYCGAQAWEAIESANHAQIDVIQRSKQASKGLLAGMSFRLAGPAQTQDRPVLYDPLVSMAASALGGMLMAVALLFFWQVRRGAGG